MECNNLSDVHDPITVEEDQNALRVFCRRCKNCYIIRKDWRGVPENRQYSNIFKIDVLQGRENLFYKVHPEHLLT